MLVVVVFEAVRGVVLRMKFPAVNTMIAVIVTLVVKMTGVA